MTLFDKYRVDELPSSSKSPAIPNLSLKYNPFPRSPSVIIDAPSEISNGGLFNPNVRTATVDEFRKKFIDVDFSDPQHLKLGFLWSVRGAEPKGFGKTALLAYYMRQINKNYGADLPFRQKVAATYTRPDSSTNNFKKLAALICGSLLRQDPITQTTIITDAVRAIRFRVIQIEKQAPKTLFSSIDLPNFESEADFERLTQPAWVESKWEMAGFPRAMRDYLVAEWGIDEDIAEVLSRYHEKSIFKISRVMQQDPSKFLFNHAISLLQAAGFKGLYIFIDDLSEGIKGVSEKNRDIFADQVRYWFIEGPKSKAARENFFTTIMTFHPDLERSLANSWRKARLNEIASFALDRPSSVVLTSLNKEDTIELLKTYIKPAITDDTLRSQNPLYPLTLETAEILLMANTPITTPSKLLENAFELIEQAKKDDKNGPLTVDYIKKFVDNRIGPNKTQDDNLENYLDEEFG